MFEAKRQVRFIETCYRLYEQKMYYVAYRILNDEMQAEDAVQEAFIRLMKAKTDFDDAESTECKKYIITVIKNAAIDAYKRNQRSNEILYFTDSNEEMENSDTCDPYVSSEVEEMMEELPEKYYEVFKSIAVEGYSVKETGLRLRITEDNVRKRYSRARKMLREMYEGRNKNAEYKVI